MEEPASARCANIEKALISTYWEFILREDCAVCLSVVDALTQKLPHIDPSSWGERLSWGGVFLNGEAVKTNTALTLPCRLEYYEPRFNFRFPHEYFPRFDKSWVIYEDEELLCVFKPARLPTMPAREQPHISMKSYLENYLGPNASIHLPSRLDMSTTGLLAVSKSDKYHNSLQRLYEVRTASKFYLLVSASRIPNGDHLQVALPIGKDPIHPILRRPRSEPNMGKSAVTDFNLLTTQEHKVDGTVYERNLICARPFTGRTHQIRVHAYYSGFPIVGDLFYPGAPAPELNLLSYALRIPHPRTKEPMVFRLPERLLPDWIRPFGEIPPIFGLD